MSLATCQAATDPLEKRVFLSLNQQLAEFHRRAYRSAAGVLQQLFGLLQVYTMFFGKIVQVLSVNSRFAS